MLKKFNNIEDAWYHSLKYILRNGVKTPIDSGSFEGELFRVQVPGIAGIIKNPKDYSFSPNSPCQLTREQVEKYFKDYLFTPRKSKNEEYTYSERINESSQLEICITMLSPKKYTNQAAISIARPDDIHSHDPPCLRNIVFNPYNGELNMSVHFRSWDVFAAMPLNLAGLGLLLDFVTGFTEFKTGSIYFFGSNAHVYSNSFEIVKEYVR